MGQANKSHANRHPKEPQHQISTTPQQPLVVPPPEPPVEVASGRPKVSLSDYSIVSRLDGGGSDSTFFFKVKSKASGAYYRMKVVTIESALRDEESFRTELHFAHALTDSPPSILHPHALFKDPHFLYTLTPPYNCTLADLLRRVHTLTEEVAQFYTAQLLLAYAYLHARGIIYSNGRPEDILITREGYLRLAGFRTAQECRESTVYCGVPEYMAPEVLRGEPYTCAADMYGLGVLAYEMLMGRTPFEVEDLEELARKALEEPPALPDPPFHWILGEFVRGLLGKSASGRPDARAARRDPWFEGLEWGSLEAGTMPPPLVLLPTEPTCSPDTFTDDEALWKEHRQPPPRDPFQDWSYQ
eukprot:TRINITY_DN8772_c0_g1_i1.p1 TRINITY_DN8772_c0_g1~~TRINITY_DN8772_c0_g1_i1.p1  ORF type:complete len:358 (+),score=72.36 TRINITY_DN8772_c0_g1_i1:53-1126(+)